MVESGEVAEEGAKTEVCRAEGGMAVRPSGGRGVDKLPKVSRNGLWPPPEEDDLDMRRRLPGLWGRVGGIVAVDANRFWQRIIKSPSAEADAGSQAIPALPGKRKGEDSKNLTVSKRRTTPARTMQGRRSAAGSSGIMIRSMPACASRRLAKSARRSSFVESGRWRAGLHPKANR
jgi:hypothetical protein